MKVKIALELRTDSADCSGLVGNSDLLKGETMNKEKAYEILSRRILDSGIYDIIYADNLSTPMMVSTLADIIACCETLEEALKVEKT